MFPRVQSGQNNGGGGECDGNLETVKAGRRTLQQQHLCLCCTLCVCVCALFQRWEEGSRMRAAPFPSPRSHFVSTFSPPPGLFVRGLRERSQEEEKSVFMSSLLATLTSTDGLIDLRCYPRQTNVDICKIPLPPSPDIINRRFNAP